MKKIEYLAPEMEVIKMKSKVTLLAGSGEIGGGGGGGFAREFDPEDGDND